MTTTDKRVMRDRTMRERQGLDKLLTTPEVSQLTGLSESLLKHGRLEGRKDLPQPIRVGQRVLYRRADVDRWLKARTAGTTYRPPRAPARKRGK